MSVRSGKRVLVHLTSGEKVVAKFKEKRARVIEFFDHEDIQQQDIRTLTIHKGKV